MWTSYNLSSCFCCPENKGNGPWVLQILGKFMAFGLNFHNYHIMTPLTLLEERILKGALLEELGFCAEHFDSGKRRTLKTRLNAGHYWTSDSVFWWASCCYLHHPPVRHAWNVEVQCLRSGFYDKRGHQSKFPLLNHSFLLRIPRTVNIWSKLWKPI